MSFLCDFLTFSKGKFANKNSRGQKNGQKNGFSLLKTVVLRPKITCFVQIFMFFNNPSHKNSLIFWLFQKKYRILHFVKKRKPKLCGNREERKIYQTSVITI